MGPVGLREIPSGKQRVLGSKLDAEQKTRSNAVYRTQPVPYEWVPEGTPRSEKAVAAPDPTNFRVVGQ